MLFLWSLKSYWQKGINKKCRHQQLDCWKLEQETPGKWVWLQSSILSWHDIIYNYTVFIHNIYIYILYYLHIIGIIPNTVHMYLYFWFQSSILIDPICPSCSTTADGWMERARKPRQCRYHQHVGWWNHHVWMLKSQFLLVMSPWF